MRKCCFLFCIVFLASIEYSCQKEDNAQPIPEPEAAEDTAPWTFDDFLDQSVSPGSDFYAYAAAGYVKRYSRGVLDGSSEYDEYLTRLLENPQKPQLQALFSLNDLPMDIVLSREKVMLADFFQATDSMSTRDLLLLLMGLACSSESSSFSYSLDLAERKGTLYVKLRDACDSFSETAAELAEYCGFSVEYVTQMIQEAQKVSAVISKCSKKTNSTECGIRCIPPTEERSIFGPMGAVGTKGSGLTESQKLLCKGFGLEEDEHGHIYNWDGLLDNVIAFIECFLGNDSAQDRYCLASYAKLCKLLTSFYAIDYKKLTGNFTDYLTQKKSVKMLMSNAFIEDNVTGKDVSRGAELGKNLQSAFMERIDSLDWMSPTTKEFAKKKAGNMYLWYGVPSSPISEFEISISESDLMGAPSDCVGKLEKSLYDKVFKRFVKSDVYDDDMLYAFCSCSYPSYTPNAFYSLQSNTMYIMAYNLIPPVSRNDISEAYNYAVIGGSTIGHEMCHGFDDQGSKFDAVGARTNWWTVSDALKFKEKQNQIAAIFSQYESNGVNLDGSFTLSENMADLGGIAVGLDALVKLRRNQGYDETGIREQTRRYLISWALAWSIFDPYTINSRDNHSPSCFRVNGQVNLIDEWYDIFDVNWGDKYYLEPQQRVALW